MEEIEFKRGTSFAYYTDLTNEFDEPIVGIAANLSSQVRSRDGKLISQLSVSEDPVIPARYIFKDLSTSDFPLGIAEMDIRYTNGDVVVYTDTVLINVVKEVTKIV